MGARMCFCRPCFRTMLMSNGTGVAGNAGGFQTGCGVGQTRADSARWISRGGFGHDGAGRSGASASRSS
eukprot:5480338-Alexandrium_andersonii.AAC.1